ncbi:MAG: NAD(P)/FAD-dependent oxidoreductase [Magnetococcales bacterium]|nr:NAD(P)/FAD-dependent oxidoreductase [Nitrospirota bacterium]
MGSMRPRVVIVGGGFGGLWALRTLKDAPVDVTLIDRNNYHTFLPLLYQVAAAELEPEDIAYPLRTIIRKMPNTSFVMADVTGIDFAKRLVMCEGLNIAYDYLILAVGSKTQFFGTTGAEKFAFQLKTLDHAVDIRNHILSCFEMASVETDEELRQHLMTFVIVGGGPTGVEFAGALAELINGPLKKDYPHLDLSCARVILLEAANSILLGFPQKQRLYALNRLRSMGVVVMLQTMVSHITRHTVHLKEKGVVPAETVLWTAGVTAAINSDWGLPTGRYGRISVNPTLQLEDHPNVYIIGDMSSVDDGRPMLPMTAPVAIQEGIHAAKNILLRLNEQSPLPFTFKDVGAMVTIGRNAAVVRLGERVFTGFIAWLVWLVVHLLSLIGFRNRMIVTLNWALDYLVSDRAVRLIMPFKNLRYNKKKH